MSETIYGSSFQSLLEICQIIVRFFNQFFDLLTVNVWSLISNSSLPSWLVSALDVANVDAFLSQFSLIGLLFSTYVVYILIAYFFIP